jgi:putative Mn2+ efflux pump MntP
MPVIGYVGTSSLYKFLVPFSKWIVFGIFFILGAKFILEAFKLKEEVIQCISLKCLIGLGIATSIDALVSGASIKLTNTPVVLACIIIGIASFLMSFSGFWSGNYIKNIPSKYLEITGGIILVLLAIKAL